ncbi:MAG: 50S ribosomal protein L23 [Flavobacteriia bacterium]|nr:50S ribosomal protein L23 [Flavobacteriia bacterium]OIP46665.1 MAG: 50S ribosomal protein L23 [Flavobacteriaceae bacterium CG2_30_31_66]PIV97934.1 MAG: 50S ribosomal protein L23 [Flavobacteriaceae bacterium CG17_big_fil_post_rev_8_21_14_2_50_31_13]PIX11709.1 MAG: 50S ribosomal protein L23 [Flavobacteriaceae bacterium CG_4_8_14_3_um_filter_31_8]PIY16209.1 MAG: 50S ribosomal protein L23 [Flavobacteriaceae bacterium CG_4_10_14_3_um_filter_31_253]PIZ11238.1 MAG: 50S ribosomal protein L23 [Flavo
MSILVKPIITEKATNDSEVNNRYTFVVAKKANKLEIKSAIQAVYGVSISSIKTLNYPVQKSTKYTKKGLVTGVKGGYKKAIVQLAEGESIDFYNNL